MRVSSVSLVAVQRSSMHKQTKKTAENYEEVPISQPEVINFRGLKFGDYLAGGICGTVFGIVTAAALGPIVGIAAGIFAGKAAAEANNETRPYDPDKDKENNNNK